MNRLFKEVLIHHEKFDKINVQLAFLIIYHVGYVLSKETKI